ncbi:protein-L-isoaspartate(D-aspartate) O-methyltransferase [Pseudorhodoplanes sp.]|uniref:protein-L-isoaspartate(D-aspartate) O-methyltransferase n=1 Tax=Pseudorhodoplanes sp. TaxID=1934341 RepID=UPI002D0ED10A|nr:protein-L-isoaspartate(D-aspartate) O-methyltransferase [Pseudorhodoplanes sp.]HWV54843.1 protein-L-isoaspartate(D-aspartate) O-methyltransferase [Pseudorhodoplanes sp.]
MWPSKNKNIDRMEFLLTLRRRGITDAAVLRAMDEVPREMFVNDDTRQQAYHDHALPIACGQTISQPYVVAYMTELLELQTHHRVLEIGTGSGYQAAVLSRIAAHVVSIERYRTLAEKARRTFDRIGYTNIDVIVGDGFEGAPNHPPFDRIIVTAAAETIPENLLGQLTDDGIMVLPVGPRDGTQQIVRLRKTPDGVEREDLIAVRFVPLMPGIAKEL